MFLVNYFKKLCSKNSAVSEGKIISSNIYHTVKEGFTFVTETDGIQYYATVSKYECGFTDIIVTYECYERRQHMKYLVMADHATYEAIYNDHYIVTVNDKGIYIHSKELIPYNEFIIISSEYEASVSMCINDKFLVLLTRTDNTKCIHRYEGYTEDNRNITPMMLYDYILNCTSNQYYLDNERNILLVDYEDDDYEDIITIPIPLTDDACYDYIRSSPNGTVRATLHVFHIALCFFVLCKKAPNIIYHRTITANITGRDIINGNTLQELYDRIVTEDVDIRPDIN